MIFSIALDVLGKAVDVARLDAEIVASGFVQGYGGISVSGDTLLVSGELFLNVAGLTDLIRNHVAAPLSESKAERIRWIDEKTKAIIARGFVFDGQRFSLSDQAQSNWMGLFVFREMLAFPINVTTLDDIAYSLTLGNLVPFVGIAVGWVKNAVGSGRDLKIAVNAATTTEELAAVVDSR